VCTHADRNDIDSELIDGTHTMKDVGEEYGLTIRALHSHKNLHLSAAMLGAAEDRARKNAGGILDRMARREAKLDATYDRTGSIPAAKVAMEHAQGYLKATGNWHESRGLDIRGSMQLSPGEQKEADLLDWLAVEYPDIHTRYLQHCEAKLLTSIDSTPATDMELQNDSD